MPAVTARGSAKGVPGSVQLHWLPAYKSACSSAADGHWLPLDLMPAAEGIGRICGILARQAAAQVHGLFQLLWCSCSLGHCLH